MGAQKKHSRVEIARKLAQANRLARQGKLQSEIARTLGVSDMTLHRWRKALLGARPAHKADQIAQLQLENSLLRRLVTDLLLLERRKATRCKSRVGLAHY
jgi:putative transposase